MYLYYMQLMDVIVQNEAKLSNDIKEPIFSPTRRGRGCGASAFARAHRRSAKCVRLLAERTDVTAASDYDSDNGKSSLNTWNVSLKVVDDRTNPFGEARYRYTLDLCPTSWEKSPRVAHLTSRHQIVYVMMHEDHTDA